ncbi:replication initiation factor domain-containing protein [Vibrio tubiashii]|uniref:replication initiation factor domain-containing protein n=1 Tax=Vibrio tubiashii TaxID=29498 RepID=UPI001EFC82D5|nr:replication initiation factor domain-containing protein [Vibrio tubiashii]MCG9583711.1 replication initiation factor domain-containing protein [Vibrio tubiashii]MCG9617289.1 replication initiation factor domain-containing protein [Vibrio tubiashii]MCG9687102.1 replication initiation factor domain-containing protein [Vibrio tubiashii]
MNKTVIDYVSFSGSPLLLERCKDMAKQRFALEQINEFESMNMVAIAQREQTKIAHFGENLAQVLGCIESEDFANKDLYFAALDKELINADVRIDTDVSFNECYQRLISNIGIDMLDTLCHGEIESFLEVLADEISYEQNEWTLERRGGFSGYRYSAKLLCNGTQAGLVAWGAANFGYYVSFSGKGCEAVNMEALYKALKQMVGAKLTRVDIALDDLQGNVSIEDIKDKYLDGQFITRGTPPSAGEFRGYQSMSPQDRKKCGFVADAGHTFYVGARENGKVFRAYDKAAQMKCEQYPNWNRFEVQIGNRYRVIPLEVLIDPDPYFAGSYPALASLIDDVEPIAISTTKIKFMTSFENAVKHARVQYGKLVNAMRQLYDDDKQILETLTKGLELNDIPDRINFPVGRDLHLEKTGEIPCH